MIQWLAAVLCLGAAVAIVVYTGLPDRAESTAYLDDGAGIVAPEIGRQAPQFQLFTASLASLSLASIEAEVTIVSFWATWCQPCRAEMRALQSLYDEYPTKLRVLAINTGESAATIKRWVEDLDLRYDILLDPLGIAARSYRIRGLPSTFLLDSAQRIQKIYYGPVNYHELMHDIEFYSGPA